MERVKRKRRTPELPAPLALLGPPLLIAGEDAAAYEALLARICAAVKPVDIIDEIFIADLVSLEWEVLRLRRLKCTLLQTTGLKALESFLVEQLGSNHALQLLHSMDMDDFLEGARARKAKELVQEYVRRESFAVTQVHWLLTEAGMNMDVLMAEALAEKFDYIERRFAWRQ
jgi:hypothetical protein